MLKKVFLLTTVVVSTAAIAQKPDTYIWYQQPAKAFEESMVLGNGMQGASVFGGITHEKFI